MGVAERREREREQLRSQIVEAARDLLLEQGLAGLSMRAIAERVEYSPGAMYLYFRDKDELVQAVVSAGFERLGEVVAVEQAAVAEPNDAAAQYGAMGRGYARFAVENPAYFRVMFELPATPALECTARNPDAAGGFESAVAVVERAVAQGYFGAIDPLQTALVGWGLIHGLTTLFLSGHLQEQVSGPEEFYQLIEDAMQSVYVGWRPDERVEGAA